MGKTKASKLRIKGLCDGTYVVERKSFFCWNELDENGNVVNNVPTGRPEVKYAKTFLTLGAAQLWARSISNKTNPKPIYYEIY